MTNINELVGKVVKVKVVGEAFTGRKTKERKLQKDGNDNYFIEYKGQSYPVEYTAEGIFQVISIDKPKETTKAKPIEKAEAEIIEAIKQAFPNEEQVHVSDIAQWLGQGAFAAACPYSNKQGFVQIA